ncbi:hypothetical protein D0A36_05450 [Xanthomonas campestris]|nr:hypothetical protein D0A41_06135 [Xanthomonas campestris]RFF60394.1 hypothetical protein D0A36_05450 [Xanthomonas campestris]
MWRRAHDMSAMLQLYGSNAGRDASLSTRLQPFRPARLAWQTVMPALRVGCHAWQRAGTPSKAPRYQGEML